ncbi:MAG: glycosyltransferase, partial [bacterium]|nr:glycosyltransferase [bacterium]
MRVFEVIGALVLFAVVLLIDAVLVLFFNTFVWPYFWPTTAFLILTVVCAIVIWFPEFGYSIWMLRVVGLLLIFVGQSYVVDSFQLAVRQPNVLTIAHLIGITGMVVMLMINYVNQIRPRNNIVPPPPPANLPVVAAVVPTYGEPYEVLERTVASIKRLDYPLDRLCIVISDDGHRDEIRAMAERFQVHYNPGPKKDAKAGNLNSALAFLEEVCPQASLVLTQDADEVVHPSLLKQLVGYFNNPKIAFVQTPKEVVVPKGDPFGTRDRMFYDNMQVGRNGGGAAFACGSGVVWRIDAVQSIGGFSTWNIV